MPSAVRVDRWLLGLALAPALLGATPPEPPAATSWFAYHVLGDDAGPWPQILSAVGYVPSNGNPASILVIRPGARFDAGRLLEETSGGAVLVLEGDTAFARSLGFVPTVGRLAVRNIEDIHRPDLPIIWEKALELPHYEVPEGARVFALERWQGAPLMAGMRMGRGGVLWLAVSPGASGYDRFPYIPQALADLGAETPLRSNRLWAFLDPSYRARADVDYLAAKWREAGIAALHVAAWHYYDADAEADAWLNRLIAACHRNGILLYAWLELPHVSEKFWRSHPEWREKTAAGQDAQLDWRKLMNLADRNCFREVSAGVTRLLDRFDWDGVNLAELYFESLEGHENAARFTPMNEDVRAEFLKKGGFDPIDLFDPDSPHYYARGRAGLRKFLDYRASLAHRIEEEWLKVLDGERTRKPYLDLVLTHVDDRLDTSMRDKLGADSQALLPLLDRYQFTFLIEDPATTWNLGPERYPEISERYRKLTQHHDRLAIDINIVERYQDVYPTKQQTGTELFRLVKLASESFPRVALYFEASLLPPDLPLVSSAAATVKRLELLGDKVMVESKYGVGLPWPGPVRVNGKPWPVTDGETAWLAPGTALVSDGLPAETPLRLMRLTANLRTARCFPNGIEISYESGARALVVVDRAPLRVELDGGTYLPEFLDDENQTGARTLRLPRGQHIVTFYAR